MSQGWIKGETELPAGTRVLKASHDYVLVDHPTIPPEADHVAVIDGRFVVVPNPDSLLGR